MVAPYLQTRTPRLGHARNASLANWLLLSLGPGHIGCACGAEGEGRSLAWLPQAWPGMHTWPMQEWLHRHACSGFFFS